MSQKRLRRASPFVAPIPAMFLLIAPAAADNHDQFPGQTPGYVEQYQDSDTTEIETGDVRAIRRIGQPATQNGPTRILGLEPTSPDAQRRADRFMETWRRPPQMSVHGTAAGTIGIKIDF